MSSWVQRASDWLWGPPMLILVLGTGLCLFVRLRAIQIREFIPAINGLARRLEPGSRGDLLNGVMAIPNLVALIALAGRVAAMLGYSQSVSTSKQSI